MKCAYRKDLIRFKTYSTLVERHLPCCKVCLKYSALISEIHYWRFLLSTWIKYPCSHGHAILVFFFFLKVFVVELVYISKVDLILKAINIKEILSSLLIFLELVYFFSWELASH